MRDAGCGVLAQPGVRLTTAPATLAEVARVAAGAQVEIGEDALDRIVASRQVVDDAIGRGEVVYGVTTGVGHARDERLPPDTLRELQPTLIEMHVGAMGPMLAPERVRAAMAARLIGFARGGAGVSLPVARGIEALLNHGIVPLMPARGSIGAGDLGQLASVGRVLIGRGEVDVDGRRLDAATALDAAGLEPVTLEAKDALAIMSSNAVTLGHGALLASRLDRLLALADLVVATSMEARHANPSVVDPVVARVRGSLGQQATSERIRGALRGSTRTEPGPGQSVQDPLSFRVVPQVHGACRDGLELVATALTAELNATADNPLVDAASARIISNGNFHPMNLTLAVESLRLGLAHVGLLCERRMGHLWDAVVTSPQTLGASDTGPVFHDGTPPALAGLGLRYPGAARYTRLRMVAQPVSLDVPPLDLAVEDHATNAAEAMSLAEESMALVEELLVIELLVAVLLLDPHDHAGGMGAGTRRLVEVLDETLQPLQTGTLPHDVHRHLTDALRHRLDDLIGGEAGQ